MGLDRKFRDVTFAKAYLKQLMDDGFIEPVNLEDMDDTAIIAFAERFAYEIQKRNNRVVN